MDTLTSRAERALLGAMLRDPALVLALGYVEPVDFALHRHRLLYTAIKNASGTWDGSRPWDVAVAAAAEEDTPLDYIDELEAACPDPGHGRTYAALVLDAHFQRAMLEAAGDAGALAETLSYDAARLTQARSPGAPGAVLIAGHADRVALVIGRHAAAFSPDTAHAPVGPPLAVTSRHERDEEHILGALINGHRATRQVLGMIGPAAFRNPLRREVFTAILAADAAGHAIDPLTVDWELGRARAWQGDNGRSGEEDPQSYVTRLAEAVPAGEIMHTARILARRQPPRAAAGIPAQAGGSSPNQQSRAMTAREALVNGSRLLQPPPEMNGNGPAPGPRR